MYVYGGNHNGRYLNDLQVIYIHRYNGIYISESCWSVGLLCLHQYKVQLNLFLMLSVFLINYVGFRSEIMDLVQSWGQNRGWNIRRGSYYIIYSLCGSYAGQWWTCFLYKMLCSTFKMKWINIICWSVQVPWGNKLLSVAGHTKDPSETIQGFYNIIILNDTKLINYFLLWMFYLKLLRILYDFRSCIGWKGVVLISSWHYIHSHIWLTLTLEEWEHLDFWLL